MECENGAAFVEVDEIKVDTDDAALNRNMYQILMQDVVVKQEDISTNDNSQVEMDVVDYGGDERRRNEAAPSPAISINMNRNKTRPHLKQPMPKPIMHRRCSRIEKSNNLVCLRYLIRRPQPTVDVHNQSSSSGFSETETIAEETSTEASNDEILLDSSAASENSVEEQSSASVYRKIEGNNFPPMLDSNGMSSATTNATSCTTASPLDIAFFDTDRPGMENVSEESINMAVAQCVQIDMNGFGYGVPIPIAFEDQQIQPTDEIQIVAVHSNHIENRCDPCAYTFKTSRNYEKHQQSKKHLQKIARMNR